MILSEGIECSGMTTLNKKTAVAACILTVMVSIMFYSMGLSRSRLTVPSIPKVKQNIAKLVPSNSTWSETFPKSPQPTKWTPYMDIIEENVILKDKPITDIRKGVSTKLSRVELIGSSTQFNVGDEIQVRITMINEYGNIRTKGGDQLRVRIFEKKKNAFASGYVIDHQNGTYTAVMQALWSGNPSIAIQRFYPRELIRAWYDALVKIPSMLIREAKYQLKHGNGSATVNGFCHPFLSRISNGPGDYCNKTNENDGMSLYCFKPESVTCQDFIGYNRFHTGNFPKTFNKAETQLWKRREAALSRNLALSVKGIMKVPSDLPKCSRYETRQLWLNKSPVGYFFQNEWRTLHCKAPDRQSIYKCLWGKHFAFHGDSTIRQWFEYMQRALNCTLTSDPKRQAYKTCFSKKYNMSVEYAIHSIPGHYHLKEPIVKSIPRSIDNFSFTSSRILVFHMQCHVSPYHSSVFRDRMMHIRKSIDNALQKYKHAKIFLKGPHTFSNQGSFSDYFGYVYKTIMLDIFKGLYDKIVYLDSKDMTIATDQHKFHPDDRVVKGMVDQLLYYVCD